MTGPILTVTASPAVESNHSLHHQHSAPLLLPDIPQSSGDHIASSISKPAPRLTFDLPSFNLDVEFKPSLPASRIDLKDSLDEKVATVTPVDNMEGPEPKVDKSGKAKRRKSLSRPQTWLPSSKSLPDVRQLLREKSKNQSIPPVPHIPESRDYESSGHLEPSQADKSRGASDSFASFAKRSWISTSRSPSPSRKNNNKEGGGHASHKEDSRERSPSVGAKSRLARLARKRPVSTFDGEGERSRSTESLGKLGSYLNRIKPRPHSALVHSVGNDADSASSSAASLEPPSSTRPSNATSETSNTAPDDHEHNIPTPQLRDPLWSAFKSLESEYSKFRTKTSAIKMNLIRSTLIPFLRKYAVHPSNTQLSPEDLERRANILNKWWTGLLEMLDGKSHQPVAGVDRPTLLETTTIVMMRPEWRLCNPSFTPLADRILKEYERKTETSSTEQSSDEAADSDFIAESAEHNVRTMFTTNLLTQMAIVVDKLSQRHAPLSLVNFAGRACAYAFFFAPGVADILVRLWGLTPDLIRRVADEFQLPRHSRDTSDDIVALFPPSLAELGWTSVKSVTNSLRQPAKPPLTAAKIAWHGAWVSRWRGRDTDLFFLFCKYYFILAESFMPTGLSLAEKGRAPAFVLVNAQMLFHLDLTVHRQAAIEAMLGPPLADVMHGADASAMALPIAPSNNVFKGMDENRLLVLLKDMLSASVMTTINAQHTFAESFMALIRSAAKRTSQFDHNACFTLCDFLEESLVAFDGFIDVSRPTVSYVDWSFWFEVLRKILDSNNTMSEIRVLSLMFQIWEEATSEPSRKKYVCLDWLLTEATFDKLFNNWCPMVRAYYMRLLCWRISRHQGNGSDLDAKIFLLVSQRLRTVWASYLWLKQEAEDKGRLPPSTAPCYPTPGKRFMIIRAETPRTQNGITMGFDSFSTSFNFPSAFASLGSPIDLADSASAESTTHKRKWNIFGKVLSFGGNHYANDLESLRRDTAAERTATTTLKATSGTVTPPASDTDSMGSSPTYEALEYTFKFTLSWNAPNTLSPPNRILTRPRLPAPAQSWLATGGGSDRMAPSEADKPTPTRITLSRASTGLIESAKNADPSDVPPTLSRISTNFDHGDAFDPSSPVDRTSDEHTRQLSPAIDGPVYPLKPDGIWASGAKYAGRALAEWSVVVSECNSFVDRRRDEGVLDLSEVEVPDLGVEGFRKLG